jgi:glycosyltransferase A (GT-A) superfamily protein (DUF2064 family)
MKSMKNLGRAVRGVAASVKKAAPMMAGAVTTTSTRMQPAIGAANAAKAAQPKSEATMKNQSDLARAAARAEKMEKMGRMTTVSQPMSTQTRTRMPGQAPLGGKMEKKPIGRMVGGLGAKFLKRR